MLTITKYTDSNDVDKIVLGFDDSTTSMMVIPIPGGGTKAEWELLTMADVTTIPSTDTKQTKQVMTVDLDGGGVSMWTRLTRESFAATQRVPAVPQGL